MVLRGEHTLDPRENSRANEATPVRGGDGGCGVGGGGGMVGWWE